MILIRQKINLIAGLPQLGSSEIGIKIKVPLYVDNVVRVRAFAGLWSAALVALPQNKPLNLPAGSLGQFGNEGDLARESVCRKPCPHVLL